MEAVHVDGFRFDLGVTLGREGTGFDPGSGFFDAIRQDPVLSRCKLISEPWDIGPDGYQLGRLPPGFAEWNDRFRDGVRRFWKRDTGMRGEICRAPRRRPMPSTIAGASLGLGELHRVHDGFTLADLVSYNEKHNEAKRRGQPDGHDGNHSFNWGAGRADRRSRINLQRARISRAMLATVMFAQGTPMLLAGDEFGRTQEGNNNAYCRTTTSPGGLGPRPLARGPFPHRLRGSPVGDPQPLPHPAGAALLQCAEEFVPGAAGHRLVRRARHRDPARGLASGRAP